MIEKYSSMFRCIENSIRRQFEARDLLVTALVTAHINLLVFQKLQEIFCVKPVLTHLHLPVRTLYVRACSFNRPEATRLCHIWKVQVIRPGTSGILDRLQSCRFYRSLEIDNRAPHQHNRVYGLVELIIINNPLLALDVFGLFGFI